MPSFFALPFSIGFDLNLKVEQHDIYKKSMQMFAAKLEAGH